MPSSREASAPASDEEGWDVEKTVNVPEIQVADVGLPVDAAAGIADGV